jgi:LacI family transcriptional regulator
MSSSPGVFVLPKWHFLYRAVCRHAAGVFRSQGHRCLGFVVPHSDIAGDLVSEEGFKEGCRVHPSSSKPADPIIIRHSGTVSSVVTKLDAVFALKERPTALLVAKPTHLFAVVVKLLKRGIRVPDDVSLICRDWDHLFENTISHYHFEDQAIANRLSRLILQMVEKGRLRPEPNLIFPRYVSCGTVKALPE